MNYSNKKVAVIGLAVSNTPLIRYLAKLGAKIEVFDKKTAEALQPFLEQLADLPLTYHLGEDYLTYLHNFDLIYVTPGMRKNLPEFIHARAEGAQFSSEMALFFEKCPGKMIGITGSSGKTTTTTLIGKMMAAQFNDTYVGGNIGRSLMGELDGMNSDSQIVLELSSFQLQELKQSPQLGVITNITPNHLDMHASMEEYIEAKSNILRYQTPADIAILNYDYEITRNLKSLVQGRLYYFSRTKVLDEGAFLDGNKLMLRLNGQTEEITTRERLRLLGEHNVENVLTAALVSRLSGVTLANITEIAESFGGVEHRLEHVRDVNEVTYYNDSISTTPDRAIAGLKAMTHPTILIAGGYDKHLPFDQFGKQVVDSCKHLLVLGVTSPLIVAAVQQVAPDFPITKVNGLEEAVTIAAQQAVAGDVVLLSPACASYDMFNNYQERGNLFKKLVHNL